MRWFTNRLALPWLILFFTAILVAASITTLHARQQQQGNVMPKQNTTDVTVSFSPQGEAADVQQLVLRFSRDMVRLGEGDSAAAPATLSCTPAQPQLKGRWIDTTRYAWEAPQPLTVGVRCEVMLRAGLKPLEGGAVQSAGPWKLSTGGPKLIEQWPYQGAQVAESQTFFLRANAPVDRASIAANLRCEIKNQAARKLILLSEADTATELRKQRRDLSAAQIKAQGWIGLRCGADDFPNDAALRLVWGKSIATPSGVYSSADQIIGYTVRPAFTARLTCNVMGDEKKEDGLQGCDPRNGLRVEFSAPVSPSQLKAISLQSTGKAVSFITHDEGDNKQPRTVYATGPLAEKSTLIVTLKDALRDVDGRALTNPQAITRKVAFGELPAYVGQWSTQATLPLAPRAGEVATWPIVVRRAGASVPLQQWRVGGETANAQALAYALKHAWDRQLANLEARGDAMPSKALLADAAFAQNKLPASTRREVNTSNAGMEFVGLKLNEPGLYLIEADHAATRSADSTKKGNANGNANGNTLSTALVQVTNLHVAFKAPATGTQGAALVWVTALDSGKPLSGATVTLISCDDARVLHEGTTDTQGRLIISAVQLDAARQKALCADAGHMRPASDTPTRSKSITPIIKRYPQYSGQSIWSVVVRKDKDIALLDVGGSIARPMDAAMNADAMFMPEMISGLITHSVLDRTLFKAGETLNMQHLLRRGTADGYEVPADMLKQRATLQLFFGGGEKVAEMPVSFDKTGSATNAWKIPANAKLGSYYGQLSFGDVNGAHQTTHSISFQVEEYRAPVFDARLSGTQQWRSAKPELSSGLSQLSIDMSLSFLAGGAAGGQAVSLRGELSEGAATPSGYSRYQFTDDTAANFTNGKYTLSKLTLDNAGKLTRALTATSNPSLFANARPVTLQSEMQFNDANGETQTIAQSFAIWPRERKLGISAQVLPNSTGSNKPTAVNGVEINAVMLDAKNAAVPSAAVKITAQRAVWKYANGRQRLELIGEAQTVCYASTDANGAVRCTWRAPDDAQNVTPAAQTDTTARNTARPRAAPETMWLLRASSNEQASSATTTLNSWQWRYTPSDAVLQIEGLDPRNAEQAMEPESNVRLLIRSPYEQSTLLLTLEREGVLTSSVHQLTTREHRLDLRVLGNYAPNVMINARLIRGLHAVPEAEFGAMQDGGVNPAMYSRSRGMGRIMPPWPGGGSVSPVAQSHTLALRVKPTAFSLKLDVTPAQTSFRPRDPAPVAVTVRGADGKPAANARVTLAVVDEALLALQPNPTWAVLEAMTRERYAPMSANANDSGFAWRVKLGEALDYVPGDEARRLRSVDAPEADMSLAARAPAAAGRMMAKSASPMAEAASFAQDKAAPPADTPPPRSNFTTLALWKTDVTTDANGKAQATVPLPDSLTRWRVVAIATHKADQFGTAEATFTTTQPLQVVSGLPLSVRSGDALTQTLTLRNTSDKPMSVTLTARAVPSFARYALSKALPAEAALRETGLLFTQTVALAAGENKLIAWPVAVPADADALKWQISAKADKASDAIEIAQVVTSAAPVTVRQSTLVQAAPKTEIPIAQPKGALPLQGGVSVTWQASLAEAALSEVREWMKQYPFACLEQKASKLSVANDKAGWDALMSELPKFLDDKGLPRFFPAQEGSNTVPGSEILALYLLDVARFNGWSIPAESRNQMLSALKASLDKKLPEQDWAPTKNDTARLLSLQATLMEAGVIKAPQVNLNDADKLPTVSLLDWVRTLLAQPSSANRAAQLDDAANLLRNRYYVQGTRLSWRNEERENWWWYMWNGNVSAARTVLVVNQWAQLDDTWKKDLPLLVKGLTARQQQGHWGTTTANVWGAIALQTFTKQAENGAVTGTSTAQLAAQQATSTWVEKNNPAPVMLSMTQGAEDTLKLTHQGTGSPWATVSILAAMKLGAPTSQGMTIKRSITPVQKQTKGQWRVGDVIRVKLSMSSATELSWVVVRDPVPSGATVLGRGLARESSLSIRDQRNTGWIGGGYGPVYEERAAESYRGYYARVPRGEWSVEYTLRLNNAGKFTFPASRVEAMYAPEIFAEVPIEALEVKP